MIEVVPASPQHIGSIATRMRAIDRLECEVMGHTPKSALRIGLLGSTMAWTVMINGRPEAMLGVTPVNMLEGRGRPWLLLTDEGGRQHRALLRLGRIYTAAMHRQFAILENWVAAENSRTIRWLSRLGYAVGSVDVIRGVPMRPFARLQQGVLRGSD